MKKEGVQGWGKSEEGTMKDLTPEEDMNVISINFFGNYFFLFKISMGIKKVSKLERLCDDSPSCAETHPEPRQTKEVLVKTNHPAYLSI